MDFPYLVSWLVLLLYWMMLVIQPDWLRAVKGTVTRQVPLHFCDMATFSSWKRLSREVYSMLGTFYYDSSPSSILYTLPASVRVITLWYPCPETISLFVFRSSFIHLLRRASSSSILRERVLLRSSSSTVTSSRRIKEIFLILTTSLEGISSLNLLFTNYQSECTLFYLSSPTYPG